MSQITIGLRIIFIIGLFVAPGACRPAREAATRKTCTHPDAPEGDGPEVTLTGVAPGQEEGTARIACVREWKTAFGRHLERERARWSPELTVENRFDDAWLDLLLRELPVETVPGCERGTLRVRCGRPEVLDRFRMVWNVFFGSFQQESWRVAVFASGDESGNRTRYHEFLAEWFRFEIATHFSGVFTLTRYLDDAEALADMTRPRFRVYRKADVIVRLARRRDPGGKPVLQVTFGHIPARNGAQAALFPLTWWSDPPAPPMGRGLPVMTDARTLESLDASKQATPEEWWRQAALFWKDQRDLHRKSGEDLKTALEWVRRACREGSGEACLFWGVMVFEGSGLAAGDELGAMEIWRAACDRGMAPPCLQIGVQLRAACDEGQECPVARPFYEKACRLGDPEACYLTAISHREAGSKEWRDLISGACRGGYPGSCAVLDAEEALLDRQVRGELPPGDRQLQARIRKAREYVDTWCGRGNPLACHLQYRSHPPAHLLPEDSQVASLLAEFEPLRRSCVWGNASSCPELFSAADVLEGKKAKAFSPVERTAWGTAGCNDGDFATCGLVASMLEQLGRYASASQMALQGCRERDAGACWMYGRLLLDHRVHPMPPDRPVEVFERGCKGVADARLGDWPRHRACSWWAQELAAAGDWKAAAALQEDLESYCEKGTGLACRLLAEGSRVGGWPPPKDVPRLDLLRKACELGDAEGCHLSGVELERTGARDEVTLRQVAAAYADGCGFERLESCEALIRLRDQPGSAVTEAQAVVALTTACWQHDRAAHCRKLSDWFSGGRSSEEARQAYLYWQAGKCLYGVPWACRTVLGQLDDPEKFFKAVLQECGEKRDLRVCSMGGVIQMAMARTPEARVARFRDFTIIFEEGCRENQPELCLLLSMEREKLDSVEDQRGIILEGLQKSCDLGLPAGCAELGYHLQAGRLTTPDLVAAERHLAWACERRHGLACSNLGMMLLERGAATGAKADLARAVSLWKAACEDLDSGVSCLNLGKVLIEGLPGLPADPKAGVGLMEKACRLSVQPACDALKKRELK